MGRVEEWPELNGPAGSIHSIPVLLTALIGRASELQALSDMLRRARLVTLTGAAGVGKTRTALELAPGQTRRRADGVWLVDLASVGRSEDVAAEVARVLGIRGAPRDLAADVVRRYLADRNMLLLLDNCEHVLDACAQLAATLLGACPNLRILAISREPLGITGRRCGDWNSLCPSIHIACFWSGPGSEGMSWFQMRRQKPPSSRSAQGSTTSRSGSSWPPPESTSCRRARSSRVSTPT